MITLVPGQKVAFRHLADDTIYSADTEHAMRYLTPAKSYTIKECRRFAFGMVMLEEVPNEWFKVAHFENHDI